ncbi:MAG: NYN domain-containing protein [Polaromonas sp.]|nr:NYN domain-containing protein [Polaromonas sp.]
MTHQIKLSAALFVDADNMSLVAVEESFAYLKQAGVTVLVRRAYGGLEKLSGLKDVLRCHAMQAFVNQGKGTTDVALVVDVMDLLYRGALPETVAIASSDADFAPLAVRLREDGMRVICFAQKDKAADVLPRSYDDVIYVDSLSHTNQLQLAVGALSLSDRKVPKPVLPASPPPVSTAMPASPIKVVEDPTAVRRILAEIPGWLPNTIRQLNQLGKPLRESGIKKGNKPLHELFGKYPTYFKVLPTTGAAKQVRLLKTP